MTELASVIFRILTTKTKHAALQQLTDAPLHKMKLKYCLLCTIVRLCEHGNYLLEEKSPPFCWISCALGTDTMSVLKLDIVVVNAG